ncbi:MAG: hypothetical protein QG602_3639 [Verrucomicrobiota bacterium]|nr:hypothetical protein [Verrucomicrobiota bacterium]
MLRPPSSSALLLSVRRTFSTTALLLAWLCANGAVWNVVQTVAWARMFSEYSQMMPVADALELTFDGSAPCDLCTIAQSGQDSARQQLPAEAALGGGAEKILLIADWTPAPVLIAPETVWPGLADEAGLLRTDTVPVPPPRA